VYVFCRSRLRMAMERSTWAVDWLVPPSPHCSAAAKHPRLGPSTWQRGSNVLCDSSLSTQLVRHGAFSKYRMRRMRRKARHHRSPTIDIWAGLWYLVLVQNQVGSPQKQCVTSGKTAVSCTPLVREKRVGTCSKNQEAGMQKASK
jgi:hypothetical protein